MSKEIIEEVMELAGLEPVEREITRPSQRYLDLLEELRQR